MMSVRQAAVSEAVQHSTQQQQELERATTLHQQQQQQLQDLRGALANKESELAATQMQLAAALESSKRVQDSHAKVGGLACAKTECKLVHACHTAAITIILFMPIHL